MRGVIIKKATVVNSDDRREILELMNGEMGIRNLKILTLKKGEQVLGNHYHWYPELMYVMKGGCHYFLRNKVTGEEEELDIAEGEIMIKTPMIVHTCIAKEDTILIDGSSEAWVGEDYNHVREVLYPKENKFDGMVLHK